MKVVLLPSSVTMRGGEQLSFLTSYLINDVVAVDTGSLGFYESPADQARVKHVLLSHTHMDHIASLPIFIENAYESKAECVTIHGSDAVLDSLRRDIFNGRVWPDFIQLSENNPRAPFLKLSRLEDRQAIDLEGLRITPIPVNHVVPTHGFLIEEGDQAILIASDTGPTTEIWDYANRHPHLGAVYLEACFPNHMRPLAELSKHLTPIMFAAELAKLNKPIRTIAVHIKARFYAQVVRELQELGLMHVEIGRCLTPYEFR